MARRRNGEGTLPRQRADGRWFSDIRSTDDYGVVKRTRIYGKSAKEVDAKLKAIRERVNQGLPPTDAATTLGAYAESWARTNPSRTWRACSPPTGW